MRLFKSKIGRLRSYWISDSKVDDCTRCSLASVVTGGVLFRGRIIRAAANPVLAPAIEIGVSKKDLVILCHFIEDSENVYRVIFGILLLTALVCILYLGETVDWDLSTIFFYLLPFWIIASTVSYFRQRKLYQLKFSYSKSSTGPNTNIANYLIDPAYLSCVGSSKQNVLLYRDFSPFEFSGVRNGGWSFVVDITKQLNGTIKPNYEKLQLSVLESEIQSALRNQFPIKLQELLVVHGHDSAILPSETRPQQYETTTMEAVQDPNFPYDREAILWRHGAPSLAPRVTLSEQEIENIIKNHPDIARRYLWFNISMWNEQLVISNFIRFKIEPRTMYIEYERRVLLPIPDPIGYMDNPCNYAISLGDISINAVRSLMDIVLQPVSLIYGPGWEVANKLAEYYGLIDHGKINCGSEPSFRQMMDIDSYTHYFQPMEVERIAKEVNTVILETVSQVLEDCGIDAADLRNKGTIIYNSGLLVQSGDVSAQALAVGEGSNAKTGVFMTPSSETARRSTGGG